MKLYKTDYTKLSKEDLQLLHEIEKSQNDVRAKSLGEIPDPTKAVTHYMTFFPNNYLDTDDLTDRDRLNALLEDYQNHIHSPSAIERSITKWIKDHEAYFIIASILKDTNFGHHETFIIPEFMLGNSYKVDYLLIGSRSGGYEFMFVELEHPNHKITIGDGELGEAFRKGLSQVQLWEIYMESNYPSLEETFNKYLCPGKSLPAEFRKYDNTRIHYAVVAGLRSDFTPLTYRIARDYKKEKNIHILHYDNLFDNAKRVIGGNF